MPVGLASSLGFNQGQRGYARQSVANIGIRLMAKVATNDFRLTGWKPIPLAFQDKSSYSRRGLNPAPP